ncbi:MAG: hypothetical protein JKY10_08465 [Cohaesibacteraceae bacterium]|nr:hypothetical protein [Cohaesibacteraceae bacterium]
MSSLTKKDHYLSHVHSILKCQYGWPAMLPDGMTWDEWDNIISKGFCYGCSEHAIAERLACEFAKRGGQFSERMDGKPNSRTPKMIAITKPQRGVIGEVIDAIKKYQASTAKGFDSYWMVEDLKRFFSNGVLHPDIRRRLWGVISAVVNKNRPLGWICIAEWNLEPLPELDWSEIDEIPF